MHGKRLFGEVDELIFKHLITNESRKIGNKRTNETRGNIFRIADLSRNRLISTKSKSYSCALHTFLALRALAITKN
jgi:hypothetical protein